MITEDFIGGHEKSFWLIAKYETMTYKVKSAKNININFDYKSAIKTYSIGPKKKIKIQWLPLFILMGNKR
ncbi:hypothetical protein S70_13810 [Providencia stuartii MRSN 2154]|uniref:Uncharacterized protein n=1 Tax=Providencia stuartii (strain MRSN 2154) TaxID=1157951 RepID=A0A140NM96_PROSM|nr:hypothetical protein S70_13810 [Providencia stuartii MRSN 2154]